MDQNKVTAVTNWAKPSMIKELQRFLGFVNFYRQCIRNFSIVAAPMTCLLKARKKGGKLYFTAEACATFEALKRTFVSAPVLKTPDPNKPFILEVDASEVGIGAVLSQRQGSPERLHPCAYFPLKLTTSAIGNCSLLRPLLKSEDTGCYIPSQCSRITAILNTSSRLNGKIPDKRAGLYFSRSLTLPSLTTPALRMLRQMRCLDSTLLLDKISLPSP